MKKQITQKLKNLLEQKYKNSLDFAFLFGSLVEGGFHENSDVDIAVIPKSNVNLLDLISSLVLDVAEELQIKEDKVDILIVDEDMSYELAFKAIVKGIPLLTKSKRDYINLVCKTASIYYDFQVFKRKLRLEEKFLKALERMTQVG